MARVAVVTGGTRAVAAEPQRNWWPYIGLAAAAVALVDDLARLQSATGHLVHGLVETVERGKG